MVIFLFLALFFIGCEEYSATSYETTVEEVDTTMKALFVFQEPCKIEIYERYDLNIVSQYLYNEHYSDTFVVECPENALVRYTTWRYNPDTTMSYEVSLYNDTNYIYEFGSLGCRKLLK